MIVAVDTSRPEYSLKSFIGYVIYAAKYYADYTQKWFEYEYLDDNKKRIQDKYIVVIAKELHLQ